MAPACYGSESVLDVEQACCGSLFGLPFNPGFHKPLFINMGAGAPPTVMHPH